MKIHPKRVTVLAILLVGLSLIMGYMSFAALTDFDIQVRAPSSVFGSTVQSVNWSIEGNASSVDIYVSYDDALSFTLLETSIPVESSFNWNVPNIDQNIYLRIDARNGSTKIRGRSVAGPIVIQRDYTKEEDSLLTLEGFDPIPFFYPTRTQVEEELPLGLEVGDLLTTNASSAVYFVGGDGKRHSFFNDRIYFSWFNDFNDVKTISIEELAEISLGQSVRVRPGTFLVAFESLNKVYALEPGGELNWILNEAAAEALYGADWVQKIISLPVSLFGNYTQLDGFCLECDRHLTGSIVVDGEDNYYYVSEDGSLRAFEGEGFEANYFDEAFLLPAFNGDLGMIRGVPIRAHEEVLFDYQDIGR